MEKTRAGRRYATVVVLMCCLAAATIGVAQNTPGVFYAPVSEDLGVFTGTYSFFGTAQLVAVALMSLVVPRMLRTFGVKWMVLMSIFCMTSATVVLAFANALPVIYGCGAVRGIGAALCANIPITIIINNWFKARNGTATSVALSFSGLMGALCSPILTWFIGAFGWRIAYLVQAGMLVACMLPPLLMPLHVSPGEEGLLPYGADEKETETSATATTGSATHMPFSFASVTFICFGLFIFMHCLITGVASHISGYAQSIGMTASFGALLLSLSMVGNILGKLLIGVLSDRLGPFKASIVMIGLNMASLALIYVGARTASSWMLVAGALLYGSVYAVAAVGVALLTKCFFDDGNYARAYPVLGFVGSIGCAVAIPAIGYVYDFTGAYDYAIVACLAIHVIDLVLITVASRKAAA